MSTTVTTRMAAAVGSGAGLRVTAPSTLVILGATGDLTARKLIPALFNLHLQGYLPEQYSIMGVARREMSDAAFREAMAHAVRKHSRQQPVDEDVLGRFLGRVGYCQLEFDQLEGYAGLRRCVEAHEAGGGVRQRLWYLATAPDFFLPIIGNLYTAGLLRLQAEPAAAGTARVVIEKPFGRDLDSAARLNAEVNCFLAEDQIYRIDHYLGKETVLNILSFRFGNAIFEELFNSKTVDHVQITVAESVGMEGRRGAFYETAGALRDIVQNHGLQLLALAAMEPPAVYSSKAIRDEKVKVLQSLRPMSARDVASAVVRGQYVGGAIEGVQHPGYRAEQGVSPGSMAETYTAMRLHVDNWRWAGVPFFLRTGKRLARRVSEIAVQFKQPPLNFFTTVECVGDVCDISQARPNVLVFRIQPDEGISLTFSAKRPGMSFQIHPVEMNFLYDRAFKAALPEAYERLLLDALRGDSTLFTRSDEVESAWGYLEPVLEAWQGRDPPPLHFYEAGSWGPPEADRLLRDTGGRWRTP